MIAEDGVEAFTEEDHKTELKYLEYVYDAKVMPIYEIIQEIVK